MERLKKSKIWKINKTKLEFIVKNSSTLTDILKYFKLHNKGNQHKTLKARLLKDGIDFTHIKLGLDANKGKTFEKKKKPLRDILKKNSNYNRRDLKKRLIKEGILIEKCEQCGLGNIWNDKPLMLQLDHINGIFNDNRKNNIRLLCPNCHSQTDNFCGRANKK